MDEDKTIKLTANGHEG